MRRVAGFSQGVVRLVLAALVGLTPGYSAPLFPDVSAEHWARDTVAALAAQGLVEGYPGGAFQGDRSASRWELALVVARLLREMEQGQATFASREQREVLARLVNALPEELEALGQRGDLLERSVGGLDRRLTELERLSFYGFLETRVVMQSFQNRGATDNDAGRRGAGQAGPAPYLNYDTVVGSRVGPTLRPQLHGVLPTVDFRNGRALSSGTGFTALGVLGLKIQVSEELDAGLELAGYSSQGDAVVDAYWGVSAPYLSNPFTLGTGAAQGLDNSPFTRMTLDRFWLTHQPTKTRVMLGNIDKTLVDSFVYAGQPNLGVFGPRRWPGYGFQVLGEMPLAEGQKLTYEIMGTRFGHNQRFQGQSYQNYSLVGDLAYHGPRSKVQLNYARMEEEASNDGGPLLVGLDGAVNTAYGASTGWTIRQWVNPPGYYVNQLPASALAAMGTPGTTTDVRPIPGWSNTTDNAVGVAAGAGNYGPQAMDTYGISGHHRWLGEGGSSLAVGGEFGWSRYRANRNSPFTRDGEMVRLTLDGTLFQKSLDLGLEYLRIDPTYNPAAWPGAVVGIRFVDAFNFTGVGHQHDHVRYPHNREGFRLQGRYRFHEGAGQLTARAALLDQTRTSLYDVRVAPNALAPGAPNFPVIGFAPGFVDPVFYGFAHPFQYGPRSANAFTPGLEPLENPRGSHDEWEFGAHYRFAGPGLKVSANYRHIQYDRPSALGPAQGGSQNLVDIDTDGFLLDIAWEASERVTVSAGADFVRARGHYDPAGLYQSYALASGEIAFRNIDSEQWIPHLAVDWNLTERTSIHLGGRYYDTEDRVNPAIGTGRADQGQIGSTTHPFAWSGLQVMSHLKIQF